MRHVPRHAREVDQEGATRNAKHFVITQLHALLAVHDNAHAQTDRQRNTYTRTRIDSVLSSEVLRPALVQEATGEVVGIAFHPDEKFGDPYRSSNLRPVDTHECWQRGWVNCDCLPLYVEIRFDGCATDYTGLGMPGVWRLSPQQDTWKLELEEKHLVKRIDHPGAQPRTCKVTSCKAKFVEVTRHQLPFTDEVVGTYQNWQGKTSRGPEKEPKGLVIDLYKHNLGKDEYFHHVYMILGRAQKLEWVLLRNFPHIADGEPDWSVFESGPPAYLCEFMEALEKRAKGTWPRLLRAQRNLGLPAFEAITPCAPDPNKKDTFLYKPEDWASTAEG